MEREQALAEYQKYVKEHPDNRDAARKSFYRTFQTDPESGFKQPKRTFQQEAKQRLIGIRQQEARVESAAAAETEQKLRHTLAGVKIGATMAPFVLAAPFTAGTSLGAGAAIMAGAGAASGIAREGIEAAEGQKKSFGELAKNVSIDAALGAGTEVGLGVAAKLGGKFLESQVLRAAQKSQAGARMIEKLTTEAHQALETSVKGRVADVRKVYSEFIQRLAKIPRGKGSAGTQLAGPVGGEVGQLAANVANDLGATSATGISALTQQPMEALVRMHSEANQLAFSTLKDAPAAARVAVKQFADDLRAVIKSNLSEEEKGLFEATKALTKERIGWSVGARIGQEIARRAFGGVVGGAVGLSTGSLPAGIAAGVGAEAIEQKLAPIILEHLATTNRLAFQKALAQVAKTPQAAESIITSFARGAVNSLPVEFRDEIKARAKQAAEALKTSAASMGNRLSNMGSGASTP